MSAAWEAQKERGGRIWIKLLAWIVCHLGRSSARLILWPLVIYFLATGKQARQASHQYLRRVLGREPRLRDTVRHFHCFSSVALDRVLLPGDGGRQLDVRVHRSAEVKRIVESRQPSLVLVSHLGSFEVLRVVGAEHHELPLRILLDRRLGRSVTELLETLDPGFAESIIDASQRGPSLVLALREALDSGHSVGIMADRVRQDEPSVQVACLGNNIALPTSPWILASVLRVPVLVAFGLFRGGNRYDTHFEVLSQQVDLPREQRAQAIHGYASQYAALLEKHARSAPLNWFNFYDYWQDADRRAE